MYCGQCGTKLQDQEKQCSNCGKPAVQPVKAATKTVNTKTWGIVALLAVLIISGLIFIPKLLGGGVDMSSPKATVTGFIKAAKKQDAEKMIGFFKPNEDMSESDMTTFKNAYKQSMEDQSFNIKDYKILSVDTNENEATVEYMIKIQYGDELKTNEETFHLEKVGDKWYINEDLF